MFKSSLRTPISGRMAHVASWGGSLNTVVASETEEVLLSIGLQYNFQEKTKRFCTSYVITEDRYVPKARKQPGRVTAQGYGNCEG